MTKMTQEDNLIRLNDKVKESTQDIDLQEIQLADTCLKLQNDQILLRNEVTKIMNDLKKIEENSFILIKESFGNICIGLDLFVSRYFETMAG